MRWPLAPSIQQSLRLPYLLGILTTLPIVSPVLFVMPGVSPCLPVRTACWTHGRQGMSKEAGRELDQSQELQTRLFSPGGHSRHNITQHNHIQPFRAFPGEAYTGVPHKAAPGQVSASWSACLQCYKCPQLLHDHYSQNVGREPGQAILASLLSSQSAGTSPAPSPVH